jgi:hypothetical protein
VVNRRRPVLERGAMLETAVVVSGEGSAGAVAIRNIPRVS